MYVGVWMCGGVYATRYDWGAVLEGGTDLGVPGTLVCVYYYVFVGGGVEWWGI